MEFFTKNAMGCYGLGLGGEVVYGGKIGLESK